MTTSGGRDYSIILPFYNEERAIERVLEEVVRAHPGAEVVAVDDGSSDATGEIMRKAPGVSALAFAENRGQSAALYAGLRAATRSVCVTMDGDGQYDPTDVTRLLEALTDDVGMVCGYRVERRDKASRRWASKIANLVRVAVLKDGIRDTGCALKCFRREAVDYLAPFNGMHRYMAALMKNAGLHVVEVPVSHRPRQAGESRYTNWNRALRGIYDLIGVKWLLNRQVRFDAIVAETALEDGRGA